jgi:hypothetical protein
MIFLCIKPSSAHKHSDIAKVLIVPPKPGDKS